MPQSVDGFHTVKIGIFKIQSKPFDTYFEFFRLCGESWRKVQLKDDERYATTTELLQSLYWNPDRLQRQIVCCIC